MRTCAAPASRVGPFNVGMKFYGLRPLFWSCARRVAVTRGSVSLIVLHFYEIKPPTPLLLLLESAQVRLRDMNQSDLSHLRTQTCSELRPPWEPPFLQVRDTARRTSVPLHPDRFQLDTARSVPARRHKTSPRCSSLGHTGEGTGSGSHDLLPRVALGRNLLEATAAMIPKIRNDAKYKHKMIN